MNLDGAWGGGLDPIVGVDVGVKTPSNALHGTGDACVGVYVRLLRHLVGLIEFCRYTFNTRAHRSGITPTSSRAHAYPSFPSKPSDTSH